MFVGYLEKPLPNIKMEPDKISLSSATGSEISTAATTPAEEYAPKDLFPPRTSSKGPISISISSFSSLSSNELSPAPSEQNHEQSGIQPQKSVTFNPIPPVKYLRIDPSQRIEPLLRTYGQGRPISYDIPNIAELLALPRCPRSPYERMNMAKTISVAKTKAKMVEVKKNDLEDEIDEVKAEDEAIEMKEMNEMNEKMALIKENKVKLRSEAFKREIEELRAAHEGFKALNLSRSA